MGCDRQERQVIDMIRQHDSTIRNFETGRSEKTRRNRVVLWFVRFAIEYPRVRQREKKFPHRSLRPRPPRGVGDAPSLVLREGRRSFFAGDRRGRRGAVSGHGSRPGHGGPGRARHHPAAGNAGPERDGGAAPRRARPADPADSRLSHRLLDHQAAHERLLPREHEIVQGGPPGGVPEGRVVRPRVPHDDGGGGGPPAGRRVRSDEQSLSGRGALHPRGESGPARDVDRTGGPPSRVGWDRRAAGAAENARWGLTSGSTPPYADETMMSAYGYRQEAGLLGLALLRPRRGRTGA